MSHKPDRYPRIHALLVHFPVSAWTGAALIELTEPFRDSTTLAGVDLAAASIALIWIGVAIASAAAIAGMVEFSRLPDDDQVGETATRHMSIMLSAFACFLLLGLAHPAVAALPMPVVLQKVLAVLGLLLLGAGGHIGGGLVTLAEKKRNASE